MTLTPEMSKAIRQLAEEKYAPARSVDSNYGHKIESFIQGAETIIGRLDIDDKALDIILFDWANGELNYKEAKNQIINALKIK